MVGDFSREYEYVQTNPKYPENCHEPVVFSAQIGEFCSDVKGCGFLFGRTGPLNTRKGPFFPYAVDVNSCNGGPNGKNTVYLPMHRACFHIALRSPRWDESRSSALRGLFRVLRHRFQVALEQRLSSFPGVYANDQIAWPVPWGLRWDVQNSSINVIGFRTREGVERGYFSKECFDRKFWEQHHYLMSYDPLNIPSLTETILKNLERRDCPAISKGTRPLRKHLRSLPAELKLMIYEYLVQDQEMPLKCTRVLGARFWKALFKKNFPCMEWLWDLDFDLLQQTDPDVRMDWELLFRKLSQGPKVADCLDDNPECGYETFRGVLEHVPPGLEGRRRVWKLVEEMRIGDRSTRLQMEPGPSYFRGHTVSALHRIGFPRDIPEVPVYWGPDGESLGEAELAAL
ncbi:hypothetical protein DHEL01_v205400 [Diaporthe helianthi]|uniref:Uncharacterized protein n=1 Tax=Diaporthe helianthi TaxID=158607 RepID=A0A2P5I100_DIAHE|nr:hypothetical protein DHEL01_v205400 [Diaporthe helianthi]